ncbi:hypothetical protein RM697_07545 [Ichthyenterobacterium sp. W332]|uniref:Tetratricopeptide repeat protein n=1 Tax=Microcosmobacter mediterraneus TaxID=3075607 RepID=A0ABU2YLC5_9FLAO|nr:hypothetical protein [Ichthyenterobacterium sp. W332]MDT0558494.1 hypothetical protein [Ichthyenterobacterium sp. W332]
MKTRITLIIAALLIGFNVSYAQQDEECVANLQVFSDLAKQKRYDEAYEPWMLVRNKCPKFNSAIYIYGERILKHKEKSAEGQDLLTLLKDHIALLNKGMEFYPKKYPVGGTKSEITQIKYDNKALFNMDDKALYNEFDAAYKEDLKSFVNPKALYTYFSLAVDLYDAGAKTSDDAQKMFDKFDDVSEKVEIEVSAYQDKLNKLVAKEEAGETLSKKDGQRKRSYESYLKNYDLIESGMNKKIGDRANCEVLIPIYQKDFEGNKDNPVWLQRAMNKMYAKGCKDDPMFVKIVEQKNAIEPNADTAFYLYLLTGEQKYFDQTVQLETDPIKKAKLYKKIARDFKDKGSYGKARQYYQEALKLNPSDRKPHLSIAAMYAKSANRCGDTNFNKRAVFWLAAQEARKGGGSGKNYEAKAPTRAEIFNSGMAGKTIKIGCWIGRSVKVPTL